MRTYAASHRLDCVGNSMRRHRRVYTDVIRTNTVQKSTLTEAGIAPTFRRLRTWPLGLITPCSANAVRPRREAVIDSNRALRDMQRLRDQVSVEAYVSAHSHSASC